MPDINAIDKFKNILNLLGDEPAIAKQHGQSIPDVTPPKQELDDDLNSLLDFASDDLGSSAEEPESEVEDDNFDFDIPGFDDNETPSEKETVIPSFDELDNPELEDDFSFSDLDLFEEEPPKGNNGGVDPSENDFTDEQDLLGELGELGDADALGELGELGDADALGELGELGDADALGELGELGDADALGELGELGDADALGELGELGDADALGELGELGDADALGELGELGDAEALGELGELGDAEALGELGELGDADALGELGDFDESASLDDVSDFEDISDLDDIPLPEETHEDEKTEDEASLDSLSNFDYDPDLDSLDSQDFDNEFDLSDFGSDFGLEKEEDDFEELKVEEKEFFEAEESQEEIPPEISDDDLKKIRKTMATLPVSLQLAISEQIGEKELSGAKLKALLDKLVKGASPREIASVTGKITGKKIEIPRSYQKSSGESFLEEKNSFVGFFKEKVWPSLRWIIVGILCLWILLLGTYKFIYTPIKAENLYSEGYEEILEDQYAEADNTFITAWNIRPVKKWFYRYCDAYIGRREYNAAQNMYGRLLMEYPRDTQGSLEYAHLAAYRLADYDLAESLLKNYLNENVGDYQALLLLGKIYMLHGQSDYIYKEEARRTFSILLERNGGQDEVLVQMLEYFIESANVDEVLRLKDLFLAEEVYPDPLIIARMTGFMIENGILDDVREILFSLNELDSTIPEVHYYLAEYFNSIDDASEEHKALLKASYYFDKSPLLTVDQLSMMIRVNNRLGLSYEMRGEYLHAEQQYQMGISRYEQAFVRNILGVEEEYGALYAHLGDIYFAQSQNYPAADRLYTLARNNRFTSPSMLYREGFIDYQDEDYREALMTFYLVSESNPRNNNILFALGNTMFLRGNYYGAQGYYNQVLNNLIAREQTIPSLRPDEREDHKELVEDIIHVYNNLGVTLFQLSQKGEDSDKYSQALVYFTKATEYYDFLKRDPDTLLRTSNSIDLSYLNMSQIMYPDPLYELQIFRTLSHSLETDIN